MNRKIRISIASAMVVTGVLFIILGWQDFLSHFDEGYRIGEQPFLFGYSDPIAFALIALAPIAVKKYFWSIVLFGLQLIFYTWLFMSRFS